MELEKMSGGGACPEEGHVPQHPRISVYFTLGGKRPLRGLKKGIGKFIWLSFH